MNKQEEHRDDELLLRLADELDPKEADRAQAHLKACWRCRTRFEDLQTGIAEVHAVSRETVVKPLLPPRQP